MSKYLDYYNTDTVPECHCLNTFDICIAVCVVVKNPRAQTHIAAPLVDEGVGVLNYTTESLTVDNSG